MTVDPSLGALDYCYLTTTGRRSGEPREIEIWFGAVDDPGEEAVARPLVHGKYASGPDDMVRWRDHGLVVAVELET